MKARIVVGVALAVLAGSTAAKAQDPPSDAGAREAAVAWLQALAAKDEAKATSLAAVPFDWGLEIAPRTKLGKQCAPGVQARTRKTLSAVVACIVADTRIIKALGRPESGQLTVMSERDFFADPSWRASETLMKRYAGHLFVSYLISPRGSVGGVAVTMAVRDTKTGPQVDAMFWWDLGDD